MSSYNRLAGAKMMGLEDDPQNLVQRVSDL